MMSLNLILFGNITIRKNLEVSQMILPVTLAAKTEKEGFEPSRRSPDLHP